MKFLEAVDRLHGFVLSLNDQACEAILNHLWYRAGAECNDRRSAGN